VTVERAALAALGGGCQVPIGIHCRTALREGSELWNEVFAVVADPEIGKVVRVHHRVPHAAADPVELGRQVARKLIDAGAGPLLENAGGAR